MSSAATKREAENDRKDREAIVAALDAQLKKGDKALIGAFRLSGAICAKSGPKAPHSFEIDAGKLAEEARFDGIFVLRTNAKVTPLPGGHCATAIFSLSRTSFAGPERSCAPGRSSIPPTPPSAAMSSAHSWRSRCKSILTISCARPVCSGMEGPSSRSRPPRPGAHPASRRRLARAHRRCSRRDHAVQECPHRLAAARPSRPTPAAGPVQIRSKPPRPPQA